MRPGDKEDRISRQTVSLSKNSHDLTVLNLDQPPITYAEPERAVAIVNTVASDTVKARQSVGDAQSFPVAEAGDLLANPGAGDAAILFSDHGTAFLRLIRSELLGLSVDKA